MKFKYFIFIGVFFTFTGLLFLMVTSNVSADTPGDFGNSESEKLYKTASISEKTKIVVYYFHGNMRCRSCRLIEQYTREAVEAKYAKELKNGTLEIRAVNVEDSENSHFIKDYQLVSKSVVVSRLENGKENAFERLDKVWRLFRKKEKFFNYIQENIDSLIKGTPNA